MLQKIISLFPEIENDAKSIKLTKSYRNVELKFAQCFCEMRPQVRLLLACHRHAYLLLACRFWGVYVLEQNLQTPVLQLFLVLEMELFPLPELGLGVLLGLDQALLPGPEVELCRLPHLELG